MQLDYGFWESKDTKDKLDEEIQKKIDIGYPTYNILFENSEEIVLIQHGDEVMRGQMQNEDFLHRILTAFINYERPEIENFHKAIEKFKEDIPEIIEALRSLIAEQAETNTYFQQARKAFWEICKESINPEISAFDIREMLIQHILTAEIFDTVFGESHFHRENNIARELETVVNTFFTGEVRRNTLNAVERYYHAIKAEAARIDDHHEKQKFLKVIYENFYKAYNPKGADRLGVVYTPNEIVKFMVESTDYLLDKHFGKSLANKNVDILDPATGTGTFICDIIEHIPPQYLEYKYKNEIHANELAVLPYYIANLNIEHTYQQKMSKYELFNNIVFVDTLDNLGFGFKDKQHDLFGLSAENLERIKRQNERKISVIIGNPPYNAKQNLYNDFNPNRKYKNIDSRAFDGFRKVIADEFNYIYIIDTQSDVRKNPKIAGTTHNVFGIQTGVALMFLVKDQEKKGCRIKYFSLKDEQRKREKLEWLLENPIESIPFDRITPDKKYNWLNITDNDFDDFIPLIDKDVKAGKSKKAVFKLFSSGLKTQRDEWVYDYSKENLTAKMKYFVEVYQQTLNNEDYTKRNTIKWDRELTKYLNNNIAKVFKDEKIVTSVYRPFDKRYFYFDKHFNGMTYQWFDIYSKDKKNIYLAFNAPANNKPFHLLSADRIIDLHLTGDSQCIPLSTFGASGNGLENVTTWGLHQFVTHYKNEKISKEDIFHYTYAVLHNPAYRRKYEINLKRDFPRLPFYKDFYKWVNWGNGLAHKL